MAGWGVPYLSLVSSSSGYSVVANLSAVIFRTPCYCYLQASQTCKHFIPLRSSHSPCHVCTGMLSCGRCCVQQHSFQRRQLEVFSHWIGSDWIFVRLAHHAHNKTPTLHKVSVSLHNVAYAGNSFELNWCSCFWIVLCSYLKAHMTP